MVQQTQISPTLMSVLLVQLAQGAVRPANLVSNVQNNLPVSWGQHSALFSKDGPGKFIVRFFKNGDEIGFEKASSPVEAKLMVLDYITKQIQEEQKQPA